MPNILDDLNNGISLAKQGLCMTKGGLLDYELIKSVGLPQRAGILGSLSSDSSSTSKATAFASTVKETFPTQEDRGSWAGALRHVMWQADITSKHSSDIARKAGLCHEINYKPNPDQRFFSNLDDADSTADLLNNEIGRANGTNYKYLTSEEQMLRALWVARTNGLFRVRKTPWGQYEVYRETMDDDTYRQHFNNVKRKFW